MKSVAITLSLFIVFSLSLISFVSAGEPDGFYIPETDSGDYQSIGFFDLRERESFVQITNTSQIPASIHVQIFNVDNNCNENNFFDIYTGNDTHIYNLRDITTNDGNPSGIVLPDNAYGIVAFSYRPINEVRNPFMIGNLRISDNNGYEYRTNLQGIGVQESFDDSGVNTFNFDSNSGVILSDIIGISIENAGSGDDEVFAANILEVWTQVDVDIYDLNEVPFSCRDVTFSCVNENNPLYEQLLEETGTSVANIEFGINNAIPHSRGGELLCPGNNISNGFVRIIEEDQSGEIDDVFTMFVGLNNGNGRGSFDSVWGQNQDVPVLMGNN